MEAPTPVDSGGAYPHVWGCPLCHRDPIEPRVANCGHIFCLMCLKDVQVTAELFKYLPRCNLCHEDISDHHQVAFSSNRTLPPPGLVNTSPADARDREQLPPLGPTVGEALAALHQRAQDPRNFYASGLSSMQSAYQHQHQHQHHHQQQYTPDTQQLPLMQSVPRYDAPQSYLAHSPSSDQIVNTIEHSPSGSVSTISEVKTSQSSEKKSPTKGVGLQDLGFYLKGELDRDGQARYIIHQNGGRLTAGATKHTNYVVMGRGARKTQAMRSNFFGGVIFDEAAFWDLMQQKLGDHVLNEQLQSQDNVKDEQLATEEAKLRAELTRLEKKTSDVKRKLEHLAEGKTGVKKQKTEASGLSELSTFVEKLKD
ncbi:hypothetical protein FKW77_005014 [Venturia effusa]|uniref:RING-type domain-containing protein n=1 Tax=Venturia effusa TaxID=50376 RepID=A0A517LIN9_9PEZI|nr:hypothetical protein FKW77_005014 [Venturia effusa]